MADKSELSRTIEAYREQHPDWSEEKLRSEAWKDLAIQTGWDVIGGTVSGGIMGGGYSAINKGIDKLQSLAQEKVDAEQQALQQLATDKLQAEQRSLAEDRGLRYKVSAINQSVLQLVVRVKNGLSSASDKVQLNPVSDDIATKIQEITGVDVHGYSVAIEARQIEHILKDHGENGATDQSMANPEDIAKIQFALEGPDSIRPAGSTRAYVTNKNGKMKPADTVLYEKQNGDGSYYVVQAVPDTKKKTLYVVTAFIGKSGYKNMEAPQSTNANSPGATPAAESAVASSNSISQTTPGVNDEFSSLEGKTILVSENREVSVKKFTGFSDGTATVKLADGTEAAEKDVAFADEAENVLFHFIAREDGMTASAANAIWSLWQANKQSAAPVPAAKFRDSAFAVWRAGVRGDSTILNDKDSRASDLTAQQKEIIYETGRKAAQDSTDAAQENINAVYEQANAVLQQKGETSNKTYRATTAEGVRVQDMDPTQRASFLMAQRIAPAVKADIEVYNGGKEWGYYNPRTDKICLNINAKWDNQTMLTFTLAHELLHRAKRGSAAQYKAFADFLVKKFGEQGANIEAMVAQQLDAADEFDKTVPENQRIHMTEAMAFEEVVADACQRMLLDTDAGKRLAEFGAQSEQNRSFLKRFARWLRELLENLRKAFKDVTPDSLAAKEFARFEENVKQTLADMFVKMNIDAGEKLSTIKEAGLTEKITTENGGVKYSLNKNAKSELHKALYDTKYRNDILLRDETPAIMLAQKGVQNLPMAMKASHIRENVFSIEEAAKLGLPTSKDINYHGLGEELFLKIIDGLDNVKEAYRGTKNADNPTRGENYFLLISEFSDSEGNVVNVPVYIDEHTQFNRVFIDINKISTVFGKRDIREYIARQIRNGNLVRIKNKSNLASERSAPIAEGYGKIASKDSIRNSEQNVNKNFEELVGSPKKLAVSKDITDREMLVDMFEQMVSDSNEYKVLQSYKKHMNEMLALEEKVERLTAEIGRLSFAEGPRDTEYLNKLKLQKKQAINRLNYYDSKLLGLEKSGVLKAMIERNRQKVTQESFDRAKAYYKERNERREADIRQYYRESNRIIFFFTFCK